MGFIERYLIPTSSIQYYAWQNIQELFASQLAADLVLALKALSLLVSFALFIGIVYFVIRTNVLKEKVESVTSVVRPEQVRKNKKVLDMIRSARNRLNRVNNEEDRSAVVDALRALEEAFKALGQKGPSLREIVGSVQMWKSTSASEVMRAYELRMRIVHAPHASLTHDEALGAVEICEKALKDLGFV